MGTYTYDSLNLNDRVTFWVTANDSAAWELAERRHVVQGLAGNGRAAVIRRDPGPRRITLGGVMYHATHWEHAHEQMKAVLLARSARQLVVGETRSMWALATCTGLRVTPLSATQAQWEAVFVLDAPLQNATKAAVGSTGISLSANGHTNGYSTVLSPTGITPVTVGAKTPLITTFLTPSGATAPSLWRLRNNTAHPIEQLTMTSGLAASTMTTIDGVNGLVYTTPLTNVVGYWPEGVQDYSLNVRTLSTTGAPVAGLADSIVGNAFLYNGSTDKHTQANAAFGITGSHAFGCWFKCTAAAGTYNILGKYTANAGYVFGLTSSFWRYIAGTGAAASSVLKPHQNTFVPAFPYEQNKWFFVCCTYSSTNGMRMYLADQIRPPQMVAQTTDATAKTGKASAGATPFQVGAQSDGAAERFFPGYIDEPFVLSQELTLQQIIRIWRYGVPAFDMTQINRTGMYPHLYPEQTLTNGFELEMTNASTPPNYGYLMRYAWEYD